MVEGGYVSGCLVGRLGLADGYQIKLGQEGVLCGVCVPSVVGWSQRWKEMDKKRERWRV